MFKLFHRSALFAALLIGAACSDDPLAPLPVRNSATLTIAPPAGTVYEADAVTFAAVFRDSSGAVVPNAPITWSVSDTLRAELSANGHVTALKAGTVRVTARSGAVSANYDLLIVRPSIQSVAIMLSTFTISRGDVVPVGVRPEGPGGRHVMGRAVTISSDNPAVALIDASGRIRGVSPGTTTIRASADGVVGTKQIQVVADSTVLSLLFRDGNRVPFLVASDTVTWDGVKEYHEVYMERGTLTLSGTVPSRYVIDIRYAEYSVLTVNGQKQMQLRLTSRDFDRGLIQFDARGDMQMTSEYIHPLSHVGSSFSAGIEVNYRIAGTDGYQRLFFRREPL